MVVCNILVIRFRRIGDSVLSMALCHGLKQSFPSANVDLVIDKGIHSLYENHPDIDHVITFDHDENHDFCKFLAKVWRTTHTTRYDVIIDMRSTLKTLWFSLFSLSTPFRIGSKKNYGKWILNYQIDNHDNLLNRVQQNNLLLQPLTQIAEVKPSEEFRLYVSDDDRLRFRQYMRNQGIDFSRPVMLVAHTARLTYKVWPSVYMKEILRRVIENYDIQIVFNFADEAEYACALEYQKGLNDDAHVFTNIKAGALTQLCALIANCDFFFGNEGGPRHIAQALGVPAYAIYPPGIRKSLWLPDEGVRFSGISPEDFMTESEQDKRHLDYHARMRLIDLESVWNGLCTALRNNVIGL